MSNQPPTLTLTEGTRPGSGSPLVRGATLGRYVVLDLLGSGGMGVVYAAYDFGLDRRICLKLVRHAGGERSAERQERLLREARAAARVSHPHVVTVHDVGTWEEHVFVAMELVEGGTLRRWLRSAQRSRAEILDAFTQAGRGLAAAHAAGLVHRDFKPDNVLVGAEGRVRVTDFGLARDAEAHSPLDAGHTSGTPAYMAPEQHRGEPASAASDQFSFALALYEALYHCSPYPASTPEELRAFKALGRFAPEPTRSKVPGWLRAALLRALSAERSARHPSMEALLGALQAPPRSRALMAVGATVTTLAACGVGLVFTEASSASRWPTAPPPMVVVAAAEPLARAQCAPSTPALPVSVELATLPSSSEAPSFPPLTTTASFTSSLSPVWSAPPVAPARSAPRPPPRFTVHVPPAQADEESTERETWLGLLARLEEALTQLGLLEPEPTSELPLLATAGLPGLETQSRAEYLLGQFGEVLAGQTFEQTHHPLGFAPSGLSAEQAEIERLEAALSSATDPVETAKLQFDLARRLYSTDTTRALQLARSAQGTLREHNLADARELLSDVDDWLNDYGARLRSRGL